MGCGASAQPAAATTEQSPKDTKPADATAPAANTAAAAATTDAPAAQTEAAPEQTKKGIDWKALNEKLPYEKTPEQKEKRMKMFSEMDMNHSNKLSLGEVSAAMEKILEEAGQELKVPEVISMAFNVAKVAAQKAGRKGSEDYVEKMEFRLLLQYTRVYFELYQLFSGMEKEGDKYVGLEEFKQAVPLLKDWGVTVENPEETFKSMDADGSGKISFQDFAEWAMKQNLDSPDDDEDAAAPAEAANETAADAAPAAEAEAAAEADAPAAEAAEPAAEAPPA